jgi:hypothetical protein
MCTHEFIYRNYYDIPWHVHHICVIWLADFSWWAFCLHKEPWQTDRIFTSGVLRWPSWIYLSLRSVWLRPYYLVCGIFCVLTDDPCWVGTAYPSETPEISPCFCCLFLVAVFVFVHNGYCLSLLSLSLSLSLSLVFLFSLFFCFLFFLFYLILCHVFVSLCYFCQVSVPSVLLSYANSVFQQYIKQRRKFPDITL